MRYYQEDNGDYLAVDHSTRGYYARLGKAEVEGRVAAIAHSPGSVCTGGVGLAYLAKRCKVVKRVEVPVEWLRMFTRKEAGRDEIRD